jgi:hypothetical protein
VQVRQGAHNYWHYWCDQSTDADADAGLALRSYFATEVHQGVNRQNASIGSVSKKGKDHSCPSVPILMDFEWDPSKVNSNERHHPFFSLQLWLLTVDKSLR